jgi:hypothetical protein
VLITIVQFRKINAKILKFRRRLEQRSIRKRSFKANDTKNKSRNIISLIKNPTIKREIRRKIKI